MALEKIGQEVQGLSGSVHAFMLFRPEGIIIVYGLGVWDVHICCYRSRVVPEVSAGWPYPGLW